MNALAGQTNRADQFAEAISLIFHPLVVIVPTMVILCVATGYTLLQAILWTFLGAGVVSVPLALFISYGVRTGRYSDVSVSLREQRSSVYALGGILFVSLLAILVIGKGPTVLIACMISSILTLIFGVWINRYTKLSLHAVGVAGCTTVLLWFVPVLGIAMALSLPLVGWARIRLKHHTPLQIFLGWAVTIASVLITFNLML